MNTFMEPHEPDECPLSYILLVSLILSRCLEVFKIKISLPYQKDEIAQSAVCPR